MAGDARGVDRAEGSDRLRHRRDTLEFSRVANLSDAVFAIAMTLLVLTLDVPEVDDGGLAAALRDRIPQFVAFLLAFGLVASVWWAHHKFFGLLGMVEPGLVAINMVLLGSVALVPFPTSLIGSAPTERAAVIPFVGLFVVTITLFLLLVVRAQTVRAWRRSMPGDVYPWLVAGLAGQVGLMLVAVVVAIWVPVAALIIAALTGTAVGIVMAVVAPRRYRDWSIA